MSDSVFVAVLMDSDSDAPRVVLGRTAEAQSIVNKGAALQECL